MLTEPVKATFKDAAKKLTGPRKRDFMAKVAEDYMAGSARRTETRRAADPGRPEVAIRLNRQSD